jgi:hypothetical protein
MIGSSFTYSVLIAFAFFMLCGCKKKLQPPKPEDEPELITTFRLEVTDSISHNMLPYFFRDADGEGGAAGYFGPTRSQQTDSVIMLRAGRTYFCNIVMLDESKNPVLDISKPISAEESTEHMIFYNHGDNVDVREGNPYEVKLNNSGMKIRYDDLDNGAQRLGIGLQTRWRTADSTMRNVLLKIELRHQPGTKNGKYESGSTDLEVRFKLRVDS